MATLGLAVAGSAIAGELGVAAFIGGAVGSIIGSYVDNAVLFPPKAPAVPERLTDLPFQTANEGAPINRVLGTEIRTAGTIIWMSELRSDAIRERFGGSGGKKATVGWNYFADFAKKLFTAQQIDYALLLLETAVQNNYVNSDTSKLLTEGYKLKLSATK